VQFAHACVLSRGQTLHRFRVCRGRAPHRPGLTALQEPLLAAPTLEDAQGTAGLLKQFEDPDILQSPVLVGLQVGSGIAGTKQPPVAVTHSAHQGENHLCSTNSDEMLMHDISHHLILLPRFTAASALSACREGSLRP